MQLHKKGVGLAIRLYLGLLVSLLALGACALPPQKQQKQGQVRQGKPSAASAGKLPIAQDTERSQEELALPTAADLIEAGAYGAAQQTAQGAEAQACDTQTASDSTAAKQSQADSSAIPRVINPRVQHYIDYYTQGNGRRSFAHWLARSGRYVPVLEPVLQQQGLPQDLVYLAMVESGFNPHARSWAHAVGTWQFIASTARLYGLNIDWWQDERRNPRKATVAAARFLKDLHARFDGDWFLAMAAYNAGAGAVQKAVRRAGTEDYWELTKRGYLHRETRNYVPKFLAAREIAIHLDKYGFDNIDYQSPPQVASVTLPSRTDLDLVARLAEVPYDKLKALNPELKRWCTPPQSADYELNLPAERKQAFLTAYAEIPAERRARYRRYTVQQGDTLRRLSQRYHVPVKAIARLNDLANPELIQVGQNLILPMSSGGGQVAAAYRPQKYTVEKGDSLWLISQRFGLKVAQLRRWNGLAANALIYPGQTLKLQGQEQMASRQQPSRKNFRYTVRSGDTLWDIGQRFQISPARIRAQNGLSQSHVLHPGDVLTLPLPSEAQQG